MKEPGGQSFPGFFVSLIWHFSWKEESYPFYKGAEILSDAQIAMLEKKKQNDEDYIEIETIQPSYLESPKTNGLCEVSSEKPGNFSEETSHSHGCFGKICCGRASMGPLVDGKSTWDGKNRLKSNLTGTPKKGVTVRSSLS